MSNYTTETYQMKREILNFSKKISNGCTRDKQKFTADMIYGLLSSKSCVLSEIAHELQEPIRKKNTIDRLSRQLAEGTERATVLNYSRLVKKCLPEAPLVFVDDSDVVKPYAERLSDIRNRLYCRSLHEIQTQPVESTCFKRGKCLTTNVLF